MTKEGGAMPRTNGKARWAQTTTDAAIAACKRIMRSVSLDVHALTNEYGYVNVNGAQWDNYMEAGRDAAMVLIGTVALVDHVEKSA